MTDPTAGAAHRRPDPARHGGTRTRLAASVRVGSGRRRSDMRPAGVVQNPAVITGKAPSMRRTALFAVCALLSAAATGFFTTSVFRSR